MTQPRRPLTSLAAALALATTLVSTGRAQAATIAAEFANDYTAHDLGSVPSLPGPYGGLTLLAGDPNTLLIGGGANGPTGAIYRVGLVRDAAGHISGFSGAATLFASAPYIDGGLTYGPNGLLFYTAYPSDAIGMLKPGSVSPDHVSAFGTGGGVGNSAGSLVFTSSGALKVLTYQGGAGVWSDATLTPRDDGTFDVARTPGTQISLVGGIEGAAYVPSGSAGFSTPSVLIAEYTAGLVSTYEVDASGNPIVSTRRVLLSGLSGAEGAFIDPLTGDFLFSTFGGSNQVVAVRGFAKPAPEPAMLALAAAGAAALGARRRR